MVNYQYEKEDSKEKNKEYTIVAYFSFYHKYIAMALINDIYDLIV